MSVTWDDTRLQAELKVKTVKLLGTIARRIEERTKNKINALNLIDTGFMINSVYSATHKESGYGQVDMDGQYVNRAGLLVWRQRADEITPGEDEAIVHVAAEYFITWELRHSILYNAVVETANELRSA